MTTAAQVEANRKNSRYSTGPRTHAGKEASKRNSTAHGLSGNGDVLDAEEVDAVTQRYDAICEKRPPTNALECQVIWRISKHWVLLEKCEDRVAAVYRREGYRARYDWTEIRRSGVRELVALLSRDATGAIVQLLKTPQGCAALIDQWDGLEGLLLKNGSWNPTQHQRALDLLGVDPMMRESGRTAFDPQPGDGTTAVSRAQQVIRREIQSLRERADSERLKTVDSMEQDDMAEERKVLDTREARLAERYRAEQARRLEWWWRILNELQDKTGQESSEDSAPKSEQPEPASPVQEAIKKLREAADLDDDEDLPQGTELTEKQWAEAEERFAQFQAKQAAAQPSSPVATFRVSKAECSDPSAATQSLRKEPLRPAEPSHGPSASPSAKHAWPRP
jgi:hypothetical protein